MMSYGRMAVVAVVAVMVLCASAYSGRKEEVTRTFQGKDLIKVNTVSGDCEVRKGESDEIEVEVISSYRPTDSFEPRFQERGKVLKLSEKMYGSNSGSSTWVLTVPEGTEVRFSTASGDLSISDLTGEFSAETASGDIEIVNCKGEFDISTASGDVEIEDCEGVFDLSTASGDLDLMNCQGEFEVSTASGDVDASGVSIGEASSFSTASGSVAVELAETAKHDLHLSSASGDVELDYDGHPIRGFFEFTAKARRGRIVSPFDFEDEETFRQWGTKYVRKTFTKESDSPEIIIETASGKAALKEG